MIALDPTNDAVVGKVEKFVASKKLQFLSERILPRSLFGIEALTSLGKKVPDLMDYTSKNKLVDFSKDLDGQLNELVGLTADEVSYIKGMIRPLAS